jgi:Ca2+-binding RTX toxin-like protein
VIPTIDALLPSDIGNRQVDNTYVRDVQTFVERVLNGEYGDVSIQTFEIGNEYWGSGEMNAQEYGSVANALSVAIQETIDLYRAENDLGADWVEPSISVQFGQVGRYSQSGTSAGQNIEIINSLSAEAIDAIDAVVGHYYHRSSFEDIETNNWVFSRLGEWSRQEGFDDIDFHITEWNVNSQSGQEFGLAQAGAVLEMFQRMVTEGVDHANIWPVQQTNNTELFGREGAVAQTAAGYMFSLLSSSVIGMDVLDIQDDDPSLEIDAFADSDSSEIFLHSRSIDGFSGEIDLSPFYDLIESGAVIVSAVQLSSTGEPTDPNTMGILDVLDLSDIAADSASQSVFINLGAYEVVQISIGHLSNSVLYEGDGNDRIFSGEEANYLQGGAGNDLLVLGAAEDAWGDFDAVNVGNSNQVGSNVRLPIDGHIVYNDVVEGGSGYDVVRLGSGNDAFFLHDSYSEFNSAVVLELDSTGRMSAPRMSGVERIEAMDGDDIIDLTSPDYSIQADGLEIDGGAGDDIIWGSHADEVIMGGEGNDVLFGGAGHDLLSGGAGADVFEFTITSENTTITDFNAAEGDTIRFYNSSNAVFDDSSFEVTETGVSIEYLSTTSNSIHVLMVQLEQAVLDDLASVDNFSSFVEVVL